MIGYMEIIATYDFFYLLNKGSFVCCNRKNQHFILFFWICPHKNRGKEDSNL
jgi:hypothetical protein